MIDFHSHILPFMDDGCKSVSESISALKESYNQGISVVALTPHFYARRETPEEFLERRKKSLNALFEETACAANIPEIITGAEVAFYSGISETEELSKLSIGETGLLLLEMPFEEWSTSVINEVCSLERKCGVTPLIAHVERYLQYQKNGNVFNDLRENGVMFQMNASYFLGFFSSFTALKMIKDGKIDLLGSDCHNLTDRKPQIGEAIAKIVKACGNSPVARIKRTESRLMNKTEVMINK